jgi:hypothetical protein
MIAFYFQCFAFGAVSTIVLIGCGRFVSKMAGLGLDAPPFCIVAALAPAFALMYYAQDSPAARYVACLLVVVSGIAAASETVLPEFRRGGSSSGDRVRRLKARRTIGQIAATVATTTVGYASLAGKAPPVLIGNNDLYNWFLIAGTLVGNANYANAAPGAADLWENLKVDAYGTNWLLALFSAPYATPLKAAPVFVATVSAWISLAIQWVLTRFFRLGPYTAFAASFLVLGSPLFLYIAFTGLLAQLVATFGSLVLVGCLLSLAERRHVAVASRSRLLVLPVLYLLSVYQIGFVAFLFIGAGLALALSFYRDPPGRPATGGFVARGLFRPLLLPLAIATLAAGALVPSVAWYVVQRTVAAVQLGVGWMLPRFPIRAFFYLPYPESRPLWLFDRHDGSILGYAAGLLLSIGAIAALRRNRAPGGTGPPPKMVRRLTSCWAWLWVLIVIYAAWFGRSGPSYQNWKFATFFSLSLCFVPVATTLHLLGLPTSHHLSASNRGESTAIRWLIAVSFWGVAGFCLVESGRIVATRLVASGNRIAQLEILKSAPIAGESVVIDLADYGPSMLAMSVFSNRARLLPLAKTYLPAVVDPSAAHLDRRTLLLTTTACADTLERDRLDPSEPPPPHTKDYALLPYLPVAAYDFTAAGGPCVWGRDIHPGAGFSGAESWGTWTDGGTAQIQLGVPPFMRGSALRVALFVQPFLDSTVARQRVVIRVGDLILAQVAVRERGVVAFVVPGAVTRAARLQLTIDLPDAAVPATDDPRRLGLGVIGLVMSAQEGREGPDESAR